MKVILKHIDLKSLQFESIHTWDAPDYVDAFISTASFKDGTELTDSELDQLNQDSQFVHNALHKYLS